MLLHSKFVYVHHCIALVDVYLIATIRGSLLESHPDLNVDDWTVKAEKTVAEFQPVVEAAKEVGNLHLTEGIHRRGMCIKYGRTGDASLLRLSLNLLISVAESDPASNMSTFDILKIKHAAFK